MQWIFFFAICPTTILKIPDGILSGLSYSFNDSDYAATCFKVLC